MREIKFRGKRLYNQVETSKHYAQEKGVWLFGTYVYAHKFRGGEHGYLIADLYGRTIMCDKKTISQFTGLQDKNGVEIYEGDKMQSEEGHIIEITFGRIGYDSAWNGMTGFYIKDNECIYGKETFYELYYNFDITEYEVIGNIHDIKVEEK